MPSPAFPGSRGRARPRSPPGLRARAGCERPRAPRARRPGSRGLAPLVPVASEARIGLPERHRLLVRRRVLAQLRARCALELLLAGAVSHERRPRPEPPPQLGQMLVRILRHAEVDQCEALRIPALELP